MLFGWFSKFILHAIIPKQQRKMTLQMSQLNVFHQQLVAYELEKFISPIRQHDLSELPVINLCQRAHTESAFPFHRKDSSRRNQCIIRRCTSRGTPCADFQVHRPQKILFLQLNRSNPSIGWSITLIDIDIR